MAKAPKIPVDIDGLVKEALLKVALAEAPLKLAGKGEGFLLPTASGANKEVVARLKDATLPLVIENGTGKTATLELAPAGFERIAEQLAADRTTALVGAMGKRLTPSARVSLLQDLIRKSPPIAAALTPLLEEAVQVEKADAEARARETERQRAEEVATLAALDRIRSLLQERKQARIEALKRELVAEGADPDDLPPPPKPQLRIVGEPLPQPTEAEDINFQRNVARRLVSSWVEAWDSNKSDAREFMESALWNVKGFRLIGEPGQRTSFDGRYHDGDPGLFTNDPVQVARPGWVLDEADGGEYVVLKARVTS